MGDNALLSLAGVHPADGTAGPDADKTEAGVTVKTVTQLSDGRELMYFDRSGVAGQANRSGMVDSRGLPPVATASEIRYDVLLDEWVVIASHRQGRTYHPPADQCPLCPSAAGRPTEIPAADYDVVVFENRFPSLAQDVLPSEPDVDAVGRMFSRRPGVGRCEVVCFTSDHSASFATLTAEQARTVLDAWADRTSELGALPEVEQVFVFENRGSEIGVTLDHPHGQIYAYPFVPPKMARMLASSRRHLADTGRCLICRVVEAERAAACRIVTESEHFTAYVPAAARWPFEVHVVARRHVPDLPALTDPERDDLAGIYLDVLRRFDGLFSSPAPYIAAWMQAPSTGPQERDASHLHAQVFSIRREAGKLKFLAGSESGAGVFINDVMPEQAAARLRGES